MRRRRAVQLVGGLVLVALVATTVGVLAAAGSRDDSPDSDERSELEDLAQRRSQATFEARYLVSLPGVEEERLRMTIWHDPLRARYDLDLAAPDGSEHLSTISDGNRRVRCTKKEAAAWQCEDDQSGTVSEAERLLAAVLAGLPPELSARTVTIGDHRARCFSGAEDDVIEVCLEEQDGIVVRAVSREATIELTELRRRVDDVVFEPPAEITSGSAQT